jgi:hypothetical protein
MTAMTTETPTFTQACRRYRTEAGDAFQTPSKTASSRKGEGWLLNDSDGTLLAAVQDSGAVLHGAALAAWSRQLSAGMPAPRR